jgi:hypothetical protein
MRQPGEQLFKPTITTAEAYQPILFDARYRFRNLLIVTPSPNHIIE